MKALLTTALACAALTACAPSPSAIAPVSAAGAYDGISCSAARARLAEVSAELNAAIEAQKSAMIMDAVSVFLVLVPVSALTGQNQEGIIAADKGKVDALNARLASCG